MSILFKGRNQGASFSKVSPLQRFVMFFVSHFRQALQSLGELWRAPAASLMTIGVLGLSITLPSTLFILVQNTEKVSAGWEQASEISIFLHKGVDQASAKQLITRLSLWPEIDQVKFVSADTALQEFQQLSGFGDAIALLQNNPLPHLLLVTPTSQHSAPAAAAELLEKLQAQREVDSGKLDIEWLERLHGVVKLAKELVSILAVLLFLAVVLIVGNTIRLNIVAKKDEILVMKLVGATDGFIHRPFMYTGFWYGLLGGLLAWFSVTILLWWMEYSIQGVTQLYLRDFELSGFGVSALLIMLGLSILLGLLGSMLSVQRHVREIEPS